MQKNKGYAGYNILKYFNKYLITIDGQVNPIAQEENR